jgi:DNA-binding PadR family transcriptional regulator
LKENENENKKKKRGDKQRFSSEYTMLSILEYLCMNSLSGHISKYHIITKVPGIKQQRQDRISEILSILEENGFIESIKTSSEFTFYRTTEKGNNAYSKWVKDFLDFARFSYDFNLNKNK